MTFAPVSTLPVSSLPEMWDIFVADDFGVEMDVSFEYELRLASDYFITRFDDEPANTPFEGSLIQPLSFRRSIMGSDGFGGLIASQGEIVVDNTDGGKDDLLNLWAFDETEVEVRVGQPGTQYQTFFHVFTGIAEVERVERARLTVPVSDRAKLLDVPLTEDVYSGGGGVDGGTDITDKRKPICFGFNDNITPVQLDSNLKLFQVHNGEVQAITAVFANGITLGFQADFSTVEELLAADIVEGKYATCAAAGLFRIEYLLSGNVITARVEGAADGGFSGTVGQIIRRLAVMAGVTEFNEAAFDRFESVHGYEAGDWFDHNDESTIADAMRQVAGYGIWFGFQRDGRFTIGRIEEPSDYPMLFITEVDILNDAGGIDKEPLPDTLNPSPRRVKVPWGRNPTVQTGTQVADGVSDDRQTWLAEQVRYASAANTAIKAETRQPNEIIADGRLRNKSDADAWAQYLLNFFSVRKSLYRINIGREGHVADIGTVVHVTDSRFDLADGKKLAVVDIDEDAAAGRVALIGIA